MQDIINHICDDDDIKAISFVGSSTVSSQILIVYEYKIYEAINLSKTGRNKLLNNLTAGFDESFFFTAYFIFEANIMYFN